jgi:hypothetical protein
MLDIVKTSQNHNGNGSDAIGGRGIRRRKLSPEARIGLATDVALGLVQIAPSIKQAAAAVGVPVAKIRAELKARAKLQQTTEREQWDAEQAGAIVDAWVRASDTARAKAVRAIGVGDVWDVIASIVG